MSDDGEQSGGPTTQAMRAPRADSLSLLWINAAALAVVLLGVVLAVVPFASDGHLLMSDEGVYLAQARELSNGSWSAERESLDIDPQGVLTPVTDSGAVGDRVVRYHKHPLFPLMLTPAYLIGGMVGAVVLSVLSTWCAAVVASFIARGIDVRYGVWTLWLVGIGSPLFFDAFIVVGHAAAAAAAGLAFLGVSRALDRRDWRHLAYGLPAVALAPALRSEGIVFVAALGLAVVVMSVGWPPLKRIRWRAALVGVAVVLLGAATYLIEQLAVDRIVDSGPASPLPQISSASRDPLAGLWASLLRPFYGGWERATLLLPLVVLAVWIAAVSLRLVPRRPLLPMVALVGAAAASLGLWVWQPWLVTGLLATSPLVVPGLLWLRRRDMGRPSVTRGLIVVGVSTVGILALNYRVGGAAEWGGRFLHLLLPILLAIAVLGLDNARSVLSRQQSLIAGSCVVLITLSIAGAVVTTQLDMRSTVGDFVDGTVAAARATQRNDDSQGGLLVVPLMMQDDAVDRFFWDQDVELLSSIPIRGLGVLLDSADAAGRTRLLIATNVDPMRLSVLMQPRLREHGWRVADSGMTPRGAGFLFLLEKDQAKP